jgi:predicted AlkP superfamily pyrophosphatase or phosphodiesterase
MSPKHKIVLDVVGLEMEHLTSGLLPNIAKLVEGGETARLEPVFPAVTCTAQASILTGKYPRDHGIVANGLYDRDTYNVSFWEQPSSLVGAERAWDIAKRNGAKTAVLFWQNTMYANSDIVVTPRPIHLDDKMVMWCYSKPVGFYERLAARIGEFDLSSYWGPLASAKSSEWISSAAEYTLENEKPDVLFVYIPHVDYSAQRFGKNSSQTMADLKRADEIVGRLAEKAAGIGIRDQTEFVIMSEYGFNNVCGAVPLNTVLRDAGLLSVRQIQGREYLDFEYSKAFAMVDHQVAHVFVKNGFGGEAKKALEGTPGVERVLDEEGKKALGIDHPRSGELVAIAQPDKWFSYYWWHDRDRAPEFAGKVDIHRKPGYDPVELFFDPKTKSIPMEPSLVKGSHGRPSNIATGEGMAFFASSRNHNIAKSGVAKTTDVLQCITGTKA